MNNQSIKNIFAQNGLSLCRFILCLNILRFALRTQVQTFEFLPDQMFDPTFLFRWLPRLGHFSECKMALIVLLVLCAVGFYERFCATLAALLAIIIFGWTYNYSFIQIADAILPVSLLALAVAPSTGSIREHLLVMRFLVVFPFFAAGYAKLCHEGIAWASPSNMVTILQFDRFIVSTQIAPISQKLIEYFLAHPMFLSVAGYSVLTIELLSPLAFLSKRLACLIIPLTFCLYLVFLYVMNQNFLNYVWPLYLYWLPWERASNKVRGFK